MSLVLIFSLFIKGIGSILEIINQSLITNTIGISGYGDYSYYINIIEIVFWIMFSNIVKCNTFYLSNPSISIDNFKSKFYKQYLFPIILLGFFYTIAMRIPYLPLVLILLIAHVKTFDDSSTIMARGYYYDSLIGEYSLGRFFLLLGILLLRFTKKMTIRSLLILYLFQYIIILWYYYYIRKKKLILIKSKHEEKVDKQKAIRFQISDCASGLVIQAPIILQHFFVGSFETGFVSIITLVRRLVNFITGPTAKVFMPEFSRLYHAEDKDGLRKYYQLIMHIQMAFISLLCIPIIGFTELFLSLFSSDLIQYVKIFQIVSFIFLFQATLGPSTSFLQMTGKEQIDNIIKGISIIFMILIWWLFRANSVFTLYGLCAQALFESISKYFICTQCMEKLPVSILKYIQMWIPDLIILMLIHFTNITKNFFTLFISEVIVLILTLAVEIINKDNRIMLYNSIINIRHIYK